MLMKECAFKNTHLLLYLFRYLNKLHEVNESNMELEKRMNTLVVPCILNR